MTRVEYTKQRGRRSICVKGHADYAEKGKDIVCAAISALTFALAQSLMDHEAIIESHISLEEGDAMISASCKHAEHEWTLETLFEFAMNGLRMLQVQYEDHVSVTENAFIKE